MPLSPGQILNNRYRIDRLLGQGGFGAVYKAWDQNLDEPVAIKESLETTPEARRQFQLEAKLLFRLVHLNLPRVHDTFVLPGQGMYLVMDFVEGEDLQTLLIRQGRLPEAQVLPWILQICDALEYLHSQNPPVIHRDIKPANIRIRPDGRAMLVDFGIAKIFDPQQATTLGAKAITSGFSPPEQYGQGASTDVRSDIYALGATSYALLTGQTPPDSIDLLTRHALALRPVQEVAPGVSQQVSLAIGKAMMLDHDQRWQTAPEFKQALLMPVQVQVQTPPTVPTFILAQPTLKQMPADGSSGRAISLTASLSRWRLPVGLAVMVVTIGLCLILGINWQSRQSAAAKQRLTETAAAQALLPVATDIDFRSTLTAMSSASDKPTRTSTPVPTYTPLATYTLDLLIQTMAPTNGFTSTLTADLSTPPVEAVAGDSWQRSVDGMMMQYVPAGEFLMGSTDADPNAESDEKPQRRITLDSYWIDRTEVTNGMYALCVKSGACNAPEAWISRTRSHYYNDDLFSNYPVTRAKWEDARDYCQWVGGVLPTEAQWEKASRGVDGNIYPWGNDAPSCKLANFNRCSGDTSAVGSYPSGASPYGVLDMAGNVEEWVLDWYQADYYQSSPTQNPPGPTSGSSHILRGGSWITLPERVRTANRELHESISLADFIYGFRCARSTDNSETPIASATQIIEVASPVATIAPVSTNTSEVTPLPQPQPLSTPSPTQNSTPQPASGIGTSAPVLLPTQKVDSKGILMALVPTGRFSMGKNDSAFFRERPSHQVNLSDFYIDVFEVTNENYAECVQNAKCRIPVATSSATHDSYYGNPEYANYPVLNITWYMAQTYCDWRNARLPTEAEWEKASRGELEGKLYPWGDDPPVCSSGDPNGANFSACINADTAPVGSYRPNGFGLFDMAGNVSEWVSDWSDDKYYSSSPINNPKGPSSGQSKGIRGGSWQDSEYGLYSYKRFSWPPDLQGENHAYRNRIGIRCARSLENSETPVVDGKPTTEVTPTTIMITPVSTNTSKNTSLPQSQTPTTPIPTRNATLQPASGIITSEPVALPTLMVDNMRVSMALVPAGEFQMGSNEISNLLSDDCKKRYPNSQCNPSSYDYTEPAHNVFLDSFYIDIYEVTIALYTKCMQAGACSPPNGTDSSTRSQYFGNPEFDNYPVIYVSWEQARVFCKWRESRLPTEAEWEKAARGNLKDKLFSWEDEQADCSHANFRNNGRFCVGNTSAVGSYPPNGFGIFDMAGNVSEWVADWMDYGYYKTSPFENPPGPSSGKDHVLRGGDWFSSTVYVAERMPGFKDLGTTQYGFRCARSP
jgi:eukaryotic-like serine/threonine-protein kinase